MLYIITTTDKIIYNDEYILSLQELVGIFWYHHIFLVKGNNISHASGSQFCELCACKIISNTINKHYYYLKTFIFQLWNTQRKASLATTHYIISPFVPDYYHYWLSVVYTNCSEICIDSFWPGDVHMHHRSWSNGNIFRITGLLFGEFNGHQWIPLTKSSDAELWYFLWSAPK